MEAKAAAHLIGAIWQTANEGNGAITHPRDWLQYLLSAGQEPIYAVDLHEALGVSKSTISATLTALREKRYVQLEGNPEDDRKKQILLTDKAVAMGEKLDASLQWQERQLCRGISSQRLKNLEEDLTMMLANVRQETGWEENL